MFCFVLLDEQRRSVARRLLQVSRSTRRESTARIGASSSSASTRAKRGDEIDKSERATQRNAETRDSAQVASKQRTRTQPTQHTIADDQRSTTRIKHNATKCTLYTHTQAYTQHRPRKLTSRSGLKVHVRSECTHNTSTFYQKHVSSEFARTISCEVRVRCESWLAGGHEMRVHTSYV